MAVSGMKPGGPDSSPSTRRRRPLTAPVPLILGGVVFLASLFVGWYVVQSDTVYSCRQISETLYPLWVQVTSVGTYCPSSDVGSYQAAGLPSTGALYQTVAAFAVLAGLLDILAGCLLLPRLRQRFGRTPILLGVIALLVAGGGAALVALEQPSAICADQGFMSPPLADGYSGSTALALNSSTSAPPGCDNWKFWQGTGTSANWIGSSGPWNSFGGNVALPGAYNFWTPSTGWFLDIVGVELTAVGAFVALRSTGLAASLHPSASKETGR